MGLHSVPTARRPAQGLCLACSMDKLYDLMLMGLKYQLLCCRHPKDILQVGSFSGAPRSAGSTCACDLPCVCHPLTWYCPLCQLPGCASCTPRVPPCADHPHAPAEREGHREGRRHAGAGRRRHPESDLAVLRLHPAELVPAARHAGPLSEGQACQGAYRTATPSSLRCWQAGIMYLNQARMPRCPPPFPLPHVLAGVTLPPGGHPRGGWQDPAAAPFAAEPKRPAARHSEALQPFRTPPQAASRTRSSSPITPCVGQHGTSRDCPAPSAGRRVLACVFMPRRSGQQPYFHFSPRCQTPECLIWI